MRVPARGTAFAAVAVITSLLLAGCGLLPQPEVTSTPYLKGVPEALRPLYGQAIVWKPCADADGFRCATVQAPLDWADPAGKRIRLALAMHPASGQKQGTLFTNPGGPGASGVDFLKSGATQFFDKTLLEHYDVVSWDPRGIGASSAVDCYGTAGMDRFLFEDPDLPAGSDELQQDLESSGKAFGQACLKRTGDLLAHVGTADTIQDLDMLRAAAGESRLDYLGFSYGTYIGALYADRYPTEVGRMVLDGAVDPSKTTFQENLANTRAFGDALKSYLAACLKARGCPFDGTVDDAVGTIADLLVSLRESPIRAQDGRDVNSAVLRTAINAALYDEGSWKYLTQGFQQLLQGDPATIQALADSYVDRTADGYASNLFEAIFAVNCLDKPVTTDPEEIARQGRQLTAADPLAEADNADGVGDTVCGNWPIPVQGEVAPVTATGAPPIVVLGTTGDPATPLAWAQSLAGQLPGGVLLTLRGEGHTAYREKVPCINDKVDAFLVSGTVPRTTVCG